MCWPLVLWYSQGLLAPVIAIVAAYIAWRQWRTNAYKVKLDLFDRRIKVYDSVREILGLMYTVVSDDKRLHNLLNETRNSEFLFGKKVNNYIEEVFHRASDLSSDQRHLNNILDTAPPEQRKVLADRIAEQVQWAFAETGKVGEKFKSALDVSKL